MRSIDPSILQVVCEIVGDQVPSICEIGDAPYKEYVADRTFKYLLTTKERVRYVVMISNPRFPLVVSRAVTRLMGARSILSTEEQDALELPVSYGIRNGTSYALWAYRNHLSTYRPYRYVQKLLLLANISSWLKSVAQQTKKVVSSSADITSYFIEPLQALISNKGLNCAVRNAGEIALGRISQGTLVPFHVLQHGDLWLGNVLMRRKLDLINPSKYGFIIIDWAGAKVSGYPFFDLVRLLMSCNAAAVTGGRHIRSMAHCLQCGPDDLIPYLMCALGKLNQEIENFPEHRFVELCHSSFDYAAAMTTSC